jgi:hypothetical protein
VATPLFWPGCAPGLEEVTPGKFPEELVFVRSEDDIVSGGAILAPPKDSARPIAVIWIHGWGVNFYYPTYVTIGRSLAERGYTCITANTRMHDIGNVAGYRSGIGRLFDPLLRVYFSPAFEQAMDQHFRTEFSALQQSLNDEHSVSV